MIFNETFKYSSYITFVSCQFAAVNGLAEHLYGEIQAVLQRRGVLVVLFQNGNGSLNTRAIEIYCMYCFNTLHVPPTIVTA